MDASTVVIIGLFVLFGVLEYQNRESTHRFTIAWMRVGKDPPESWYEPKLWKLITITVVTIIFAGFTGFLGILGMKQGMGGPVPLVFVAATFVPPLVILILMIIRDLRKYVHHRRRVNSWGEEPT
jgi:sterol desaturase/sphingolipid hydroxylase (fatty acid hydroxylase superfamily)